MWIEERTTKDGTIKYSFMERILAHIVVRLNVYPLLMPPKVGKHKKQHN